MLSDTEPDGVIESVSAAAYSVPTDAPEADGTLTWDATTIIVVEISAAGRTGIGWTYGDPAVVQVVRHTLGELVTGRPVVDIAALHTAMAHALRNIGRSGIGGQALSAVDTALWDLKARLLDLPLYRLLGAERNAVAVYGSGGFTTYNRGQLDEQLVEWVQHLNLPRVKIKVGESWGTELARDLARMRQVRDTVGADVEIFVDANGAYSVKQAVRLMEDAADLDIRWFEEPVSSDDIDGLRAVRTSVRADIAAGEYGYTIFDFRRLCEGRAIDCLQVDVSRCGGVTEWQRAAAMAAAHGLDVSGHCAPYLHSHIAATVPNFRHLEWFHDHVRIERMFFDGVADPTGGAIHLDPSCAGNGLHFKSTDAERFRVA